MGTDQTGVFGGQMKEGSVLDKIMVWNSTTNHSTDSSKNELTYIYGFYQFDNFHFESADDWSFHVTKIFS